jgi:hypothetical protein
MRTNTQCQRQGRRAAKIIFFPRHPPVYKGPHCSGRVRNPGYAVHWEIRNGYRRHYTGPA